MAEVPDVKRNENDGRPGDFAKGLPAVVSAQMEGVSFIRIRIAAREV
jgi:hypothetical protein